MAELIAGDFVGKAVKAEVAGHPKTGKPTVQIVMSPTEGPHAGKRFEYQGKLDAENIKYTKAAMLAIGWAGKTVASFAEDVTKAALVVPFETNIANWTNPDTGEKREWTAVRSIGRGAMALVPLKPEEIRKVDSWFDEVSDAPSSRPANGRAPQTDVPF